MGFFKNIKANLGAGKGMFGKEGGFGSGQGLLSRIGQGGEGFMGKFGTGEGAISGMFDKQKRMDRNVAMRDDATKGTHKYNRIQNRINRLSGDPTRHKITGVSDYNRSTTMDEGLGDTSLFDPTSHEDTLALQRKLFPDDESQWDGIFGPQTQQAYQNWMGENKGYSYEGNPLTNAANKEGLGNTSTLDNIPENPLMSTDSQINPSQAMQNLHEDIQRQDALEDATGNRWGMLGDIYQSLPGVGDNPNVFEAWGDRFRQGGW
jgi:hypothetical protein